MDFRYTAFISYSHADETWGQVLASLGRDGEANSARSATLDTWLAGEPTEPVQLAVKARLLRQPGHRQKASREIARLQVMHFAHPEFRDLFASP